MYHLRLQNKRRDTLSAQNIHQIRHGHSLLGPVSEILNLALSLSRLLFARYHHEGDLPIKRVGDLELQLWILLLAELGGDVRVPENPGEPHSLVEEVFPGRRHEDLDIWPLDRPALLLAKTGSRD